MYGTSRITFKVVLFFFLHIIYWDLMNKYKVYVYAICKNESKFIQRWYDSVKEADKYFYSIQNLQIIL